MAPEIKTINIPVEVLGLSDIKIKSVEINRHREVKIEVASIKEQVLCRQCHKPTRGHGVGRVLELRHLPVFGLKTFIVITPRRGICEHCDDHPTTTECLDWYDARSHYTKPYEKHVLFELINSTVSDVAIREDLEYHSIEGLIDKHIEQEVDFNQIVSIGVLWIDEISLKKGHRDFVTLVTYRAADEVNVLAVLKGRTRDIVETFFKKIPRRLKKTIRAVCSDLYEGYIQAAKAIFKGIPVIADRFHVSKLYRKSLISLRKSELKRLKKILSDAEYKVLKGAILILKKQKDHFSEDEKRVLKPLFELSPALEVAYHLSAELTSIFNSHLTPEKARKMLFSWISKVQSSQLSCFNRFIKTLTHHIDEISNYFISRESSGFVEGFNNRVKVLKRRCYGFRNITRFFQRILLDTTGFSRFSPWPAAA